MAKVKKQVIFKPDKCPKFWEKARRDKLKGLFEELSRLLPQHDPATPVSRLKIVQRALSYIRELQAQNEDLLNGGFDEVHRKKIETWKKRVKELVCRVEQLTGILRTANIHVPTLAFNAVPAWTKAQPKHWTEKISIPEDKINEVMERITQVKRKKNDSVYGGKKDIKKRKKIVENDGKIDTPIDSGSKENQPTTFSPPKNNCSTQTTGSIQKAKKQVCKIAVTLNNVVSTPKSQVSATLVTGNHQTPSLLQGSVVTPLAQPNTYILTNQGNLLPVITPSANLLTPLIINRPPPVLVVQQPPTTPPQTLPVFLPRPPANKRRIQRESTVMTFTNRIPIPALSNHSHPRRGGKCAAHKIESSTKTNSVSPTSEFLNTFPVVTSSQIATSTTASSDFISEKVNEQKGEAKRKSLVKTAITKKDEKSNEPIAETTAEEKAEKKVSSTLSEQQYKESVQSIKPIVSTSNAEILKLPNETEIKESVTSTKVSSTLSRVEKQSSSTFVKPDQPRLSKKSEDIITESTSNNDKVENETLEVPEPFKIPTTHKEQIPIKDETIKIKSTSKSSNQSSDEEKVISSSVSEKVDKHTKVEYSVLPSLSSNKESKYVQVSEQKSAYSNGWSCVTLAQDSTSKSTLIDVSPTTASTANIVNSTIQSGTNLTLLPPKIGFATSKSTTLVSASSKPPIASPVRSINDSISNALLLPPSQNNPYIFPDSSLSTPISSSFTVKMRSSSFSAQSKESVSHANVTPYVLPPFTSTSTSISTIFSQSSSVPLVAASQTSTYASNMISFTTTSSPSFPPYSSTSNMFVLKSNNSMIIPPNTIPSTISSYVPMSLSHSTVTTLASTCKTSSSFAVPLLTSQSSNINSSNGMSDSPCLSTITTSSIIFPPLTNIQGTKSAQYVSMPPSKATVVTTSSIPSHQTINSLIVPPQSTINNSTISYKPPVTTITSVPDSAFLQKSNSLIIAQQSSNQNSNTNQCISISQLSTSSISTNQHSSMPSLTSTWSSTSHFIPSGASCATTDVSWSPINSLKSHTLQSSSSTDNSWLVPSSISLGETNKVIPSSLPSSSGSWRPLPNDVFWNTCPDNNWICPMANKDNIKKSKNVDKSGQTLDSIKNCSISGGDILHAPSTCLQWSVSAPSASNVGSSQIGLYPFCSTSSSVNSMTMVTPSSETTWTSSVPKTFGTENAYSSNSIVSNQPAKMKVAVSTSSKSQCKDQSYYSPSLPNQPIPTPHCSQDFLSNTSTFVEPCPITAPSSQIIYSKSKQTNNSSTATSKSYSNISNLVSSHSQPKSLIKDLPVTSKQLPVPSQYRPALVTTSAVPTYLPSSKFSKTESLFPPSHYSMSDTTLYNPFADSSYTSNLLKQSLPENSSYAVNFVNAYANEGSYNNSAPYPLNVTKSILSDPSYSLSGFKTSMNDGYYPGVPVYSNTISNVLSTEPVLYQSNSTSNVKNVTIEPIQISSVVQNPAVAVTTASSHTKNSASVKSIKAMVQINNTPSTNYSSTKNSDGIAGVGSFTSSSNLNKIQLSSKSHSNANCPKTNESTAIWNSSYFTQSVGAATEVTPSWGQNMDYNCGNDSKDVRPKPPINWMTDHETRTDVVYSAEDSLQHRYSNNFERKDLAQNSQNIFEYCMNPPTEDELSKDKTRKKDMEALAQDYYSWVPMKMDPLVVPGTLPTLVGDLALGGDPIPNKRNKSSFLPDQLPTYRKDCDQGNILTQEPFTNLSKNIFDTSQNEIPKTSPSTETIVLKNIFELPTAPTSKQKTTQGQNSFLSVSQLVDSHNLESTSEKNDFSCYNQKTSKSKRTSGWKCNEKKCSQGGKSCSNYSAEALMRSQESMSTESDFTHTSFPIEFSHDNNLIDSADVLSNQLQGKPKTYSPRHRKQDCWKAQNSASQTFPTNTGKSSGKSSEAVPLTFSYLPDARISAPPLTPCNSALPFPRFPSNPTAPLLASPSFTQHKTDAVQIGSIFPSSPSRACNQLDGNLSSAPRFPASRKSYNYQRSSKTNFPPCSPSFSNEQSRKGSSKSTTSASQSVSSILSPSVTPTHPTFPVAPPLPSGPSGSSLANFHLSTIFPEMNKKGAYQYPP